MMTSSDAAAEIPVHALVEAQRRALSARADHLMGWVVVAQAPVVLLAAVWLAPRFARGDSAPPLVVPLLLAAVAVLVAATLARLRPGQTATRHVLAVAQMGLSAVLLYASGGHGNLHLHAVGSFVLIALYRDWPLVATGSAVVLGSHVAALAYAGPVESLASQVVTHTLWLALLDMFLVFACVRAAGAMEASAQQQAAIAQADRARADQMRQLAEVEGRSAAMLNAALDAIVSMDERGTIVEFNPAAERLFGYRREEAVGRELRSLIVPPALREAHRAGVERYFKTGEARLMDRRVEVRGWRADGTEVPIELALTEIRVPAGPRLTMAFMRDITERQRAEAALRSARDAAEDVSRAKSEFVANMGHEMRTPIHALLGLVDVMRAGEHAEEDRLTLRMMEDSARRLLHVINDLLDFSHLEAGRITLEAGHISPRTLVDEVHAAFGPRAAEKGLDFSMSLGPGVPRIVTGDAGRVAQVLRHLVDNALKFTSQGRVSVDITAEDGPVTAIAFAVADTGIGIPLDRQASIFEAFTQADGSATRRFGGTGLGLTLAAHLVSLMGGQLTFTSVEGEGSTFRFVVPFAHPHRGESSAESRAALSRAALERLGGDDALLGKLVAVFLASYPEQLTALRSAVASGQADAIRCRAQAIRGAVAFLADEDAVEAAVRVEAAAGQPGAALDEAMQGLETSLDDLEARLVDLRENTGA